MTKEEIKKGYHCAWQIHYHIVFSVKYRKALLDGEVTKIIVETAEEIEERYAIEMEAIGYDNDSIHPLCGDHPKISPGKIVQIFKSITAREIFCKKPSVKRELWGGEFWSGGYYVATLGERANWKSVERYIQRQGQPKTDLANSNYLIFDTPQQAAG